VFTLELSRENALRYLKKENPELVNQSKGLVLFTYKKLGLGWAKILDNRINNYLPNELKILR
jgi:NOL1/NOP2/fmu family ribosome biogenesis protein